MEELDEGSSCARLEVRTRASAFGRCRLDVEEHEEDTDRRAA